MSSLSCKTAQSFIFILISLCHLLTQSVRNLFCKGAEIVFIFYLEIASPSEHVALGFASHLHGCHWQCRPLDCVSIYLFIFLNITTIIFFSIG